MQIPGEVSGEYLALQRKLKRRGIRINTLHAALRIPRLEGASRMRERELRICKLVAMLGGIRVPDLVWVSALTQPTLWRLVQELQARELVRVVATYRDRLPGRRATWLQPPGSADLDDDRRAVLIETAQLIREYIPLWQAEQGRLNMVQRRAQDYP